MPESICANQIEIINCPSATPLGVQRGRQPKVTIQFERRFGHGSNKAVAHAHKRACTVLQWRDVIRAKVFLSNGYLGNNFQRPNKLLINNLVLLSVLPLPAPM